MAIIRYDGCLPGTMTHDILGHRASSRFVSEVSKIPYGVVVEQGTTDTFITQCDSADEAGKGASSGKPIGISVRRIRDEIKCGVPAGVNATRCTLTVLELPRAVNEKDYYDKNEAVSVCESGTIWARCFEDVKKGEDVKYLDSGADTAVNATDASKTKYLGMVGKSGTVLPNAKFDSSAKAFELVMVRLNK